MAYDEQLAGRVRKLLHRRKSLTERKMFGGVGFMLRGNMCCGVLGAHLILRVSQEQGESLLTQAHSKPFDVFGAVKKGMVMVAPAGVKSDAQLKAWLEHGVCYALTLPAK